MKLKEMNRYMSLVNKLMWIMDHSGVSWDPKYAEEAEKIRKELKELRPIIEEARKKQKKNIKEMERCRKEIELIKIHYKKRGGEKPCTEEN